MVEAKYHLYVVPNFAKHVLTKLTENVVSMGAKYVVTIHNHYFGKACCGSWYIAAVKIGTKYIVTIRTK